MINWALVHTASKVSGAASATVSSIKVRWFYFVWVTTESHTKRRFGLLQGNLWDRSWIRPKPRSKMTLALTNKYQLSPWNLQTLLEIEICPQFRSRTSNRFTIRKSPDLHDKNTVSVQPGSFCTCAILSAARSFNWQEILNILQRKRNPKILHERRGNQRENILPILQLNHLRL